MTALQKFFEGKKSYIVAACIIVTGVLNENGIEVPVYVWSALAALGLAAIRDAIKK